MPAYTKLSPPFISKAPVMKVDPATGLWILPEGEAWSIVRTGGLRHIVIVDKDGEQALVSEITGVDETTEPLMSIMFDMAHQRELTRIISEDNERIGKLLTN